MKKLLNYKRKQKKQVCLTQYLNKYITEEWFSWKGGHRNFTPTTMGNGTV